jgi:hypothetical protein
MIHFTIWVAGIGRDPYSYSPVCPRVGPAQLHGAVEVREVEEKKLGWRWRWRWRWRRPLYTNPVHFIFR